METTLHLINNYAHIGFGSLALLGGVIALSSTKGSSVHVRGGRLFAWMMLFVVITTLLAMYFELLPLAIVMCLAEIYLIPSALLSVNRSTAAFTGLNVALAVLAGLLCLFTAIQFVRFNVNADQFFIGPAVLAALFGFLLAQDVVMLQRRPDRPNFWVRRHLTRMILAFTFAIMALVRIGMNLGLSLEMTVVLPLLVAALVIVGVYRRYPDGGGAPA